MSPMFRERRLLRDALVRAHQIVAVNTGTNLLTLARSLARLPTFWKDMRSYREAAGDTPFPLRLRNLLPALADREEGAGTAAGHYFHQDLWAARRIYLRRPTEHIDIGSRIDGFVAHLLVFMPVTVIDVRPLPSAVPGLSFIRDDATSLPSFGDQCAESISCLHAAEHFGLGRYGDPIDPQATFKLMGSLDRILARGGHLYFSVPVGRERLEFNAHRIFNPQTILGRFPALRLVSFSAVDDGGALRENIDPSVATDWDYGCGLFEFTRE